MTAAGQVGDMDNFHKFPVRDIARPALADIAIDAHHYGIL
jgi:hypothetical protein